MKKRLSVQQRLLLSELLSQGTDACSLSLQFGLSLKYVTRLQRLYARSCNPLFSSRSNELSVQEKLRATLSVTGKVLSLQEASLRYRIPLSTLHKWKSICGRVGERGLAYLFELQINTPLFFY